VPDTRPPAPARVAIVRALPGLGDGLCAVPALRSVRRTWPGARVTLIGLPAGAWLTERFPQYVDELLALDAWPGLAEVDGPALRARPFLRAARARRFDLAIQMHGDGRASNRLTAALGARRRVGLTADPGAGETGCAETGPRGASGEAELGPYPADRHEIERCLTVVRLAGASADDATPEFPLGPTDQHAADRWVRRGERFAVVHPGASRPERQWGVDGFIDATRHLLGQVERVVLTGGDREEPLVAAVRAGVGAASERVLALAGATELGTLGAVLHRAALIVANDTGVVHLAAAVGTPAVVVGGASDWRRWAPWGRGHRQVGGGAAGAWPLPSDVRAAIDAVLGERRGQAA
jgi:ADP-heptose:LPS heptosyltransferase